jgi:molecular chaperone GrpE
MTETPENMQYPEAESFADPAAEIAALRAQLLDAEQKLVAVKDQQLRAIAEAENVRKRAERDTANTLKYASERLLGELLGVCDSLELGLKAAEGSDAQVKALAEGMQLTHKQLIAFFDKHGVRQVDPAGELFNPDLHEAVTMIESAQVPAGHVLTVMQKGYRLHERLLRPAMVVVARAPAAS